MAEYSRLASGQVISTGGNTPVIIPFVPNIIEIYNATRAVAVSGVTRANWSTDMGQGAAFYTTTGAGPADGTAFISSSTGGGFSTFQGGIALQFGPSLSISAMTKSSTAPQITTSTNHNLVSGNVVVFQNLYQTSSTGQIQLANIPFVVTVIDATNFTIAINNNVAGYTALSSPLSGTVKQVLYPDLYVPGIAFVVGVNTSTNTITTSAPHNYVVGQEVAFRIPTAFGTTQLNALPNILTPGSPNYYFVSAVGSSTTFTVSRSLAGYTAFTTNQSFASAQVGGFTWPQSVAVGDANSGSLLTNFVSPSFYNGSSTSPVNTINGPAIAGAFCNNTNMGFIIGGTIAGTAADVIYWNAYMVDINL